MKDLINIYNKTRFEKDMKEYENYVLPAVNAYKKDFPIDKVKGLTLDEYVISAKGKGSENTFCARLLDSDMVHLASRGTFNSNFFEVFNHSTRGISTFGRIAKKYNNDIDKTFEETKNEILRLLNDPTDICYENTPLNKGFASRMLFVYYPDKFIPVGLKMLGNYCDAVNIKMSSKTWIKTNMYLQDVIRSYPESKDWNNFIIMRFCDWVFRSNN